MSSKIKLPFLNLKKVSFSELYEAHKKDIDAVDKDGNTLVHLAVIYNKYEYLKPEYFQNLKELLDKENDYGLTPKAIAELLGRPISCLDKPHAALSVYMRNEDKIVDLTDKEVEKHFKIKYQDRLEFKNYSYLNFVCKNIKRAFRKSELKWKNHWTCCMHEAALKERFFPKTYVKWIDPLIGYGLFAGEDLTEYMLVGEYTGVLRKRQSRKDKFNDYIFGYTVAIYETPFVIDAQKRGNYTRFINHCDEPNLFSTWMISGGICHVILFAKHAIPKGTQLTYDYGPNFWKKRSDPLLI